MHACRICLEVRHILTGTYLGQKASISFSLLHAHQLAVQRAEAVGCHSCILLPAQGHMKYGSLTFGKHNLSVHPDIFSVMSGFSGDPEIMGLRVCIEGTVGKTTMTSIHRMARTTQGRFSRRMSHRT